MFPINLLILYFFFIFNVQWFQASKLILSFKCILNFICPFNNVFWFLYLFHTHQQYNNKSITSILGNEGQKKQGNKNREITTGKGLGRVCGSICRRRRWRRPVYRTAEARTEYLNTHTETLKCRLWISMGLRDAKKTSYLTGKKLQWNMEKLFIKSK